MGGGLGGRLGTGEPWERVGVGDGLGVDRVGAGVAGADGWLGLFVGDAVSSGNFGVLKRLAFLSSCMAAVALTMNCCQIGPG